MSSDERLGRTVGRGLAWGALSTVVLRLSNMLVGIVLARLLAPQQFGVYAVALTVQGILITVTDLGLSADLVRAHEPLRREPTVALLSLMSGIVLASVMIATARPVAQALGGAQAAPVIMVLAFTIVVAGAGVVPFARMQRAFQQKQLFYTSAVDFTIGTLVTVALVLHGWGPMALAVGRVVAQPCATALQFILTRCRPRFGFDRALAGSALAYGLPLAGANLLSMALLNVDNVVVVRLTGATALGYYVLAFNVASWPMTAIGQTVRPVALAAFSRLHRDDVSPGASLSVSVRLTWPIAVVAAIVLMATSIPLVAVLYGGRWLPAAPVLAALATFGALRVVFDLFATFLMARGATHHVMWIQGIWLVALVPAMIVGAHWWGLPGAGWAHVAVGAVVVMPAYLWAGQRAGAAAVSVLRAMAPPVLGAIPAYLAAWAAMQGIESQVGSLVLGAFTGVIVYSAVMGRWLMAARRGARGLSAHADPRPPTIATEAIP